MSSIVVSQSNAFDGHPHAMNTPRMEDLDGEPNATAGRLYRAAFFPGRDPRSDAYRYGVFIALRRFIGDGKRVACPWPAGTAEADAFWSGTGEGSAIARQEKERQAASTTTTQTKRAA